MMPDPIEAPGPYASACDAYLEAGWRGVLPLPARNKKSPPTGYTGRDGIWPSYPDVHAWATGAEGIGNIGIRLPQHVIGLDVDNYGSKPGAATLQDAINRFGPLPSTWRSTSRDDGVSGILLYRVPEGLRWPGELGDGTEIIQYRHRYVVAWPSLHPEGRTYRWIDPDGLTSTTIPVVDELPPLPDPWVAGLTGGESAADITRTNLGTTGIGNWLVQHDRDATMCRAMSRTVDSYITEVRKGTRSRHDATLMGTSRLAHMAAEGHAGVLAGLGALHDAFISASTAPGEGQRTSEVAAGEWGRALTGAVEIAAGDPESDEDPCLNPFAGIMAQSEPASLSPTPDKSPSEPAERTTWWPKDLAAAIDGRDEEPPPLSLARDDGNALFYAGRVNGLIGESESGKTWVALLAVVQALEADISVVYLDFEDSAVGVVGRLRAMGITDFTRFTYISPDETLHTLAKADLSQALIEHAPGLVVVDGVNAAMTLLGLDINSNNDATQFSQHLLKPIAATGATVIYVDHLPKDADRRGKGGIGAQAKRAMTTGCAVLVDVIAPFGRGMTGKLRMSVDKDRPGHVRAVSLGARNAGLAVLTSDPDTGSVTVRIQAPDLRPPGERPRFRPTHLMERVSHYLSTVPDGVPGSTVETEVKGKGEGIREALNVLVDEGYVARSTGLRGAILHRSIRVYSELEDLTIGVDQ